MQKVLSELVKSHDGLNRDVLQRVVAERERSHRNLRVQMEWRRVHSGIMSQ